MGTINAKKQIENLANNTKVNGFTHSIAIGYRDLAETAVSTADTFTATIPANSRIKDVFVDLKVPFQNTADATNNTTTLTVGDNSSASTFIASQELNANGTTVKVKSYTGTPVTYAAANLLKIAITPMTATALSPTLNAGLVVVYFNLIIDGQSI